MYGTLQDLSSNSSIIQLLLNILLFGTMSSFTHCIGMCGGIAMGQSALRMIESQNSSTLEKVISCISWEYYIGKAITYMVLTFIVMKVSEFIDGSTIFHYVKFISLLVVILYLVISGVKVICKLCYRELPNLVQLKKFYPKLNLKYSFGNSKTLSRLVIGICLGFIPCGVVYTAIGIIVSSTKNTLIATATAFLFGLTTFPGLFILSYTGNVFFYRYSKLFNFIYLITVIVNIKFLIEMM